MVRHLGTLPTISPRPLMSLLGFVCILQTVTSSLYLAVVSTHTAVGCFRSPVRRSGTRCLTSSEILPVVLTVLSSFLRQSCLVFTNVTSALEVFLKIMRYMYYAFYLLCYLPTNRLLTLFSLRYFLLGDALSSVGLYSNEVAV